MKVEFDINLKRFEDFEEGDCFLYRDRAYIKSRDYYAVCLSDGHLSEFGNDQLFEPVNLVAHIEKNMED